MTKQEFWTYVNDCIALTYYEYGCNYCPAKAYYDEGFYGKGDFDSVKDWSRRKWSRIRKINHRNKRK